jgi:hypothetical protein
VLYAASAHRGTHPPTWFRGVTSGRPGVAGETTRYARVAQRVHRLAGMNAETLPAMRFQCPGDWTVRGPITVTGRTILPATRSTDAEIDAARATIAKQSAMMIAECFAGIAIVSERRESNGSYVIETGEAV